MFPDTRHGRSSNRHSRRRAVGGVVIAFLVVISGALSGTVAAVPSDELSSLSGSDRPASNHRTLVTGTVEYEAPNGTMVPAKQVKVQIRKNGLTNPVIATGTTNDSGQYAIPLDVANHENSPGNQQLNVKVQALAKNPAVKVIGFGQNFQGGSGRKFFIENTGQIQVGADQATFNMQATAIDERRAFQVANWALEAYRFHNDRTGVTHSRVKVNLNASLYGDRYLSHIDKIKLGADGWDSTKNHTVHHEYGHAILDALYDNSGWKIPHIKTWFKNTEDGFFPCHTYFSETSDTYAWYEGFAYLTEAAVNEDPNTENLGLESTRYFNDSSTDPDCHDGDASKNPDYDGAKVEGAVASILWDLYDGKNEPHDDINTSLREIYATVSKNRVKSSIAKRNTKKVKSIHTFWDQYVNESNHAELGRIYFEYGIQKPDRFENNDSPSAAAPIRHGVTKSSKLSGGYPVDGYNRSGGAQLNYGDSADHYTFAAQRDQWVSIEIDSTQGDANANLRVYAPSGTEIANSTSPDSNESVSFRAPESGTFVASNDQYRFEVTKGASGRAAGTYTFNLSVEPADKYDDKYEDNAGLRGATPMSPGDYEDLKFVDVDASDTYAIQLASDESLEVTADFFHSETDLNMFLYHPYIGSPSNSRIVARSTTNTDDETIRFNARQSGTHYLRVRDASFNKIQASYDLTIEKHKEPLRAYEEDDKRWKASNMTKIMTKTVSRSDQVGTLVAGYKPGDVDYYRISLNSAEDLKVNLTDQKVDATLVDRNGNYVDSFYSGRTRVKDVRSGGTYYLKVEAGSEWVHRYEVGVAYGRGIGSDHLEPNNGYDSATEATPAIGVTSTSGTISWKKSGYGRALELDGTKYDEDYFEVSLDSGDTVTATATYDDWEGKLSLELIGTSGQTETSSGPGNGKQEVSMTASSSGTYYVKITDASNRPAEIPYDLTIEKDTSVLGNQKYEIDYNTNFKMGQLDPVGIGSDSGAFEFNFSSIGQNVGPSGTCTLEETKEFSRTVSVSGGTSAKIGRVRSFPVAYRNPCKVVIRTAAPKKSAVNAYITLDGSRPTTSNYQVAGQQSGSAERIVIKPSDGLRSGATLKALVRGYPVSGTYEVIVQVYTR